MVNASLVERIKWLICKHFGNRADMHKSPYLNGAYPCKRCKMTTATKFGRIF